MPYVTDVTAVQESGASLEFTGLSSEPTGFPSGNSYAVLGLWYTGSTACAGIESVSDSAGNTWEFSAVDSQEPPAAHVTTPDYQGAFIAWCVSGPGGGGATVTPGNVTVSMPPGITGAFIRGDISSWTDFVDIDTASAASGTVSGNITLPSIDLTYGGSSEVVLGVCDPTDSISGVPSGSTQLAGVPYFCYQQPSSSGSFTFTWPASGSQSYAAVQAALKGPAPVELTASITITPSIECTMWGAGPTDIGAAIVLRAPTVTVAASATGSIVNPTTYRPNDGSGYFADLSNTGWTHYPGSRPASSTAIPCTHGYDGLYDYTSDMEDDTPCFIGGADVGPVFCRYHFRGKALIADADSGYPGDNYFFHGCVFDGTFPNDNLLQNYSATSTHFIFCTFKPDQLSSPPGGSDGSDSVSSAHYHPGTPYLESWQYLAGYADGRTVMDHCDVWGNAGMEITGGGTSWDNPTIFQQSYIHDQSDTDWSTGIAAGLTLDTQTYHQDGIGPASGGLCEYVVITGCTVSSLGTSNGIAFQSTGTNDTRNMIVTSNYITGWGISVSLGAVGGEFSDTGIVFTDNVYSGELPFIFFQLYGNWTWSPEPPTSMVWRRNRLQFRSGDPTDTGTYDTGPAPVPNNWTTAYNNKYWWPTDNDPHTFEYSTIYPAAFLAFI